MAAFVPTPSLAPRARKRAGLPHRNASTPTERGARRAPQCSGDDAAAQSALSRRAVLRLSAAAALAPWIAPRGETSAARAAATLGEVVEDGVYGYSFRAPAGWASQKASLSSARSAIIYTRGAGGDDDSNINFVVTPVPGDFQKLGSFGTIDNVLATLVPRGKADIDGEVISTKTDSSINAYVIEYTVTSRGVKRHLVTIFSLQPGRYLLTLTGQAKEEVWAEVEATVRDVVGSYKLTILD